MPASLFPLTGQTRRGLPVSRNAAPPASIAAYVARTFVTHVGQPDDQTTSDILLNESAFVRILVCGHWEARMRGGRWQHYETPILFGAQGRPLPVRVRGGIGVVGFAIRPGAWRALFDGNADALADSLVSLDSSWPELAAAQAEFDHMLHDPDSMSALVERLVRARIAARGNRKPAADMAAFEAIARAAPTRPVAEVAAALGEPPARFARRVRAFFGHPPKLVLRRARFLDMAAKLRGISMPSEERLAALRFYDQSHVNREFRLFTGMTPAEFARTPTPLLTLGIESRQLRKAEEGELAPGEQAPWLA